MKRKDSDAINAVINAIPSGVYGCSILIRHSLPILDGPDETRTLTKEGIQLCHDVKPVYLMLLDKLKAKFGPAYFGYSSFPRTFATLWEIFQPEYLQLDNKLAYQVSLTEIPGDWLNKREKEGLNTSQIITMVNQNLKLLENQPYEEAMERMEKYFSTKYTATRFYVAIGHEHEPSLWVAKNKALPPEEIGLAECQAYVVFINIMGSLLKVVKFCPSATLKSR